MVITVVGIVLEGGKSGRQQVLVWNGLVNTKCLHSSVERQVTTLNEMDKILNGTTKILLNFIKTYYLMCWLWWKWLFNFLNWVESGGKLITHITVHCHLVDYSGVVAIISNVAIVHWSFLFSRFDTLACTVPGTTSVPGQSFLLLHHRRQWSRVVSVRVVRQRSSA